MPQRHEGEYDETFEMDMSQEKEIKPKMLLPAGWRKFIIEDCHHTISKQQNNMFIFSFVDSITGYETEVYAIAEQGKRWFLKQILASCDSPAGQDGIYKWKIRDVLDKPVSGLVIHEPNEYYNRKGEKIEETVHRIAQVKKYRSDMERNPAEPIDEEQAKKNWEE